ncbi:hypothetical protein F5883DRAFT_639480 [Diaporthe sp. PMI_573]|nr:hypothetical protein F5883DRAFT_639480 [Diaporthaceae sp. PMI_573]
MPNNPSSTQVNDDLTLPFDISAANSTPTQTRIPSFRAESKDYTRRFKNYTVLQQHVLFWDRDADGQIHP